MKMAVGWAGHDLRPAKKNLPRGHPAQSQSVMNAFTAHYSAISPRESNLPLWRFDIRSTYRVCQVCCLCPRGRCYTHPSNKPDAPPKVRRVWDWDERLRYRVNGCRRRRDVREL